MLGRQSYGWRRCGTEYKLGVNNPLNTFANTANIVPNISPTVTRVRVINATVYCQGQPSYKNPKYLELSPGAAFKKESTFFKEVLLGT